MKTLLSIIAGFSIIFSVAYSQTTFQKTIHIDSSAAVWCVKQTSDDGFIMVGEIWPGAWGSGDVQNCLLKTDEEGEVVWMKTYTEGFAGIAQFVQQTFDQGFIVTGGTSLDSSAGTDVYLMKTDASGNTQWIKKYAAGRGYSVQQTSDGGYIVSGFVTDTINDGSSMYLIKTDANGDTLWTRRYPGFWGKSVEQTIDGGYVVVGHQGLFGQEDIYLIRTDSVGDTLWTSTYKGLGGEEAYVVQQTPDGGFIIAGNTGFGNCLNISPCYDVLLLKIDADGGPAQWAKTYKFGSEIEFGFSMLQTTDGGYVLSGSTYNTSSGQQDAYLMKTNNTGGVLWTKLYGSDSSDVSNSVDQTADGGFILGGWTTGFGVPESKKTNIYLIKTDSLGNSGCNEISITPTVSNLVPVSGNPGGIVASVPGQDTVVIVTINDVITDSTLCKTIGIAEENQTLKIVSVYPNPTTGIFTVQGATGEIQVYDLFGRLVLRTNKREVDMSSYPAGIYMVKAGEAVRKLIVH